MSPAQHSPGSLMSARAPLCEAAAAEGEWRESGKTVPTEFSGEGHRGPLEGDALAACPSGCGRADEPSGLSH